MHILTGLLLAGLLGKNKFRRRDMVPSYADVPHGPGPDRAFGFPDGSG